jgi:hypothetical protein
MLPATDVCWLDKDSYAVRHGQQDKACFAVTMADANVRTAATSFLPFASLRR